MGKSKRVRLPASEQDILDHLHVVVLGEAGEIKRCDKLIEEHHYLRDATLVGEHLRYAVVYREQWLALASWSAAARHLRDRDQFIGWTHEQCRRRRALIANNARLLVLPGRGCPNLISRFMKLMLQRLSADWEARWGHPIALVETFVDPKLYQGTAYKVSGWSHLGRTAGWKRDADDFYLRHDSPKQIWVRELSRKACVKLRARELPEAWAQVEAAVAPKCTYRVEPILSLMELFKSRLPEFRRPQSLGYPLPGMLSLIVMAMATGVRQGPDDLADYAQTLSSGQLRALNFRRDRRTGQYRAPKRTTFRRVLEAVDASALEGVLLQWQDQLIGPTQERANGVKSPFLTNRPVGIATGKCATEAAEIVKSSDLSPGVILEPARVKGHGKCQKHRCDPRRPPTWAGRLSWRETSRIFRTSWEAVYRSVEWFVEWGLAHRELAGVEAIGIDEIHWGKGKRSSNFLTLIYQIDEGRRRLLWVGQKRTQATLRRGLSVLGPKFVADLRFVCSDMWKAYLTVIASMAGHTLHVVDRFHVMMNLNKAVDEVRRTETTRLRGKPIAARLKKMRWKLLRRGSRVRGKARARLAALVASKLATGRAWSLKEAFQHFWSYRSVHWAGAFLDYWCERAMRSRMEPMKRIARMLRSHEKLLLNWFRARGEISSGAVEGLNNKIRVVTRRSYGFRTYKGMELALYHNLGRLPEPPMTHRFC